MNKITKWCGVLFEMNKDEKNKDINELRSFLFRIRGHLQQECKLIEEISNEENE